MFYRTHDQKGPDKGLPNLSHHSAPTSSVSGQKPHAAPSQRFQAGQSHCPNKASGSQQTLLTPLPG